jgi:hypothetical protein
MVVDSQLRKVREEIVQRHIDTELAGDLEGAIATFAPGRVSYDIPAIGRLMDEPGVREYLTDFMNSTGPDRRMEVLRLHHADEAVIVEVRFHATLIGPGQPEGGTRVSDRHCVIFRFDGEELWQEASYGAAVTGAEQR